MLFDLTTFLCARRDWGWEMWPFGPGFGADWGSTLARYGISLVFLIAIGVFLRLLFGPGGPLRPKEFGVEHIAERRRRKAELKEVKAAFERGEMDAEEYMKKRTELRSDD
jgi:uncharacterized membrane protein